MKTERENILEELLSLSESFPQIVREIKTYPWDSDEELVTLKAMHVINVLERYVKGGLSEQTVEDWANAIEGREDIGFEEEKAKELERAIYDLANPVLCGNLTTSKAGNLIHSLVL